MPVPERIRAASREKRRRVCVICGTEFLVRAARELGRTCSMPCRRTRASNMSRVGSHSPEASAKRSATLKAAWADPEKRAKRMAAASAGLAKWHSDPENAKTFAKRSSERMKRRHADPEWQAIRDERSSRTMKDVWKTHREALIAARIAQYAAGSGLNTEEAKRKRNEASKWILQRAMAAMHAETDYDEVFADVQATLRREMPYDGPQNDSDYFDYCSKLGKATVSHPRCREIADGFMSKAIPRFAGEWQSRKANDGS